MLLGRNDSGANLAEHSHGAEIEYLGCFRQRYFATLGPFVLPMDREVVPLVVV